MKSFNDDDDVDSDDNETASSTTTPEKQKKSIWCKNIQNDPKTVRNGPKTTQNDLKTIRNQPIAIWNNSKTIQNVWNGLQHSETFRIDSKLATWAGEKYNDGSLMLAITIVGYPK